MSEPLKSAASDEEEDDDRVIQRLKQNGKPVTRQRYLDANYVGGNAPKAKDWTVAHEADLPRQLQDWSLFKDGRYIGPPIDETVEDQ